MPVSHLIPSLRSVQLIGTMVLISTIVYAVAGVALLMLRVIPADGVGGLPAETKSLVESALCAVGLLAGAASILIRRQLDSRTEPGPEGTPIRFRNAVMAMAMAESPGVMGFVAALLTGDLTIPVVLWGAAIAGCLLHFPTRATLGMNE